MTHDYRYPLPTGEADRLRLEILYRLYGPGSQHFMLRQGLQPGMHVLEIGCGMGDMACWLARQVGPTGKVTAIDVAEDSLQIAKEKARQQSIVNVQFLNLDVREVESLGQQLDFAYGRWVLVFLSDPYRLLKKIYNVIKSGGIFAYESTNVRDPGFFSHPIAPVVAQYADVMKTLNANSGRESEFGYRLCGEFKSLGLENIDLCINQPILTTAEEKSVLRLPMKKLSEEILKFIVRPGVNHRFHKALY